MSADTQSELVRLLDTALASLPVVVTSAGRAELHELVTEAYERSSTELPELSDWTEPLVDLLGAVASRAPMVHSGQQTVDGRILETPFGGTPSARYVGEGIRKLLCPLWPFC